MKPWLHLCVLICYFSTLSVMSVPLHAVSLRQDEMAILQLENQSDQPLAICDIFAVRMPAEVVLDRQGQIDLAPGESKQFSVPPGHYRLLVSDCEQNSLVQQQDLLITRRYVLPLAGPASPAPPPSQPRLPVTGEVTLRIYNEAEQTICYVFMASLTTPLDEGQLFEAGIVTGETHNITIVPDIYNLALVDCAGNFLLIKRDLPVKQDIMLSLTQADVDRAACEAYQQEGGTAYRQSHYQEALAAYQAALACFRQISDHANEGAIHNHIGSVYADQGRYGEALASYEQALTIGREMGDRASEGATLHNIGTVYANQGRYNESLDFYEQALTIVQSIGDRADEGTALNSIAGVYYRQGRYSKALAYYDLALAVVQAVGDRTGKGTTLNNIGAVYTDQGRYSKALEYYEQALTIHREVGDRAGEGATLNNIGAASHAQGHYAEALAYYDLALAIVQAVGNRTGEGTTLNNIGAVYTDQGRYGEALERYEQALAILRAVGDRASEGVTFNNIGFVYEVQGRYSEARERYEQALAIAREIGGRDSEGDALNNIGGVYYHQRRYGEALERYEQALVIAQEVGDRAGEGITLHQMGGVYLAQRRHGEALERYKQALRIIRGVGNRAGEGKTLNNIGLVYDRQGRYEEALATYQQALAILHELGDRAGEGTTLINIGSVYDNQGRYGEALRYYSDGIEALESVRSTAGSDQARTSFIEGYAFAYDRVISLSHQQGDVVQAFWYSERGRARVLLDTIATGQVQLSDNEAAILLTAEQEAYALRQSALDVLAKARAANPPDPAWVDEAEAALAAAETAYEQAAAAITAYSAELASFIPGRQQVPQLADVQALLPADTTLLSYWTLEDKTLAFVITDHNADIIELPGVTAQTVLTMTTNLLQWRNREVAYPLPLRQLYAALIVPLADKLQTPHLIIIPHQSLHYVPFAALIDDAHNKQYLGEKYTLTLLPSASVLPFLQQNAAAAQANPTGGAVVFGDPASNEPDLPRLHNAAAEAGAVAALLATTVLTDTAATEALLYQTATDARIVHLAAHGQYNSANALYSALYLAPSSPLTATDPLSPTAGLPTVDSTLDGRLETWEIFGLPLNGNDLVVLSACETTVNDLAKENRVALSRGDELVSLTRAFIFAGAPTVIASLWSVDDAATETLMVAFYKHWLQDGMSKAQALQAAQADVHREPRWASPFYWAGFVLHGDPGESGAK